MRPAIPVIVTVIWMMVIFGLSELPASATGPSTPFFKIITKLLHFIVFGILAVLYLLSLKRDRSIRQLGPTFFIFSFVLTVLYAVIDEYHQTFSLGRTPSVGDVFLDSCGAFLFLGTVYVLKKS